MATHSSILAWEIPWTEDPGRLIVHGVAKSQTQLSTHTHAHTHTHTHAHTPDNAVKILLKLVNGLYQSTALFFCHPKTKGTLRLDPQVSGSSTILFISNLNTK